MLRIEMLDQDKSHTGIERQMLEQLRERFQAASRSAHADDGKGG